MPNLRKKINRIAPFVISAAMLLSLSAVVYGYYGDYDDDDDDGNYEEETTTTRYYPISTTTTTEKPAVTPSPSYTYSETTTTRSYPYPNQTTTTRSSPTQTTTPDGSSTGTTPNSTGDETPDGSETTTPQVLPPQMSVSFTERWLEVGDGVQLTAQVINTEEYYPVSFTSSDTSVAIVDSSGYIFATGAGFAYITAYSGNILAYVSIYVAEPPAVPEFIVLTEDHFVLKIDETAQIQARLLPEDAAEGYYISYYSNDASIAKVDENGVITALSEGETTITVEGAGLYETVYVTVSSDIAYDTARLDGYLYDGKGKPVAGSHLTIGDLSAVTDKDGYFVFDDAEQRSLTIRLVDDKNAACGLTVTGDITVYLLYDSGALTRLGSYEELAGRLAINSVKFDSASIVLTAGEVYELSYLYEPSDATITAISYSSSNSVAAAVGQVDGVITAKSPGEAIITISLNNGQAMAECTITVNPRESSEHSVLIVAAEATVFAAGTAVVLLSYRSYRRKALSTLDDEEEENDADLHDID